MLCRLIWHWVIPRKKGFLTRVEGADLGVRPMPAGNFEDQVIDIMPGDLLIEEKNLPKPNIVKIDVEGYEYLVIKGLENALREKPAGLFVVKFILTNLLLELNPKWFLIY